MIPEEPKRQETVNKKTPISRRKPETSSEFLASKKSYEVKEIVDEPPARDQFRKSSKPRVVTENSFEAKNAPPTHLFQPSTTESIEEVLKNIGAVTEDNTSLLSSTVISTSVTTEAIVDAIPKIEDEVNRNQPEAVSSSTTTTKLPRKNIIRTRTQLNNAPSAVREPATSPLRSRPKYVRKNEISPESTTLAPRSPSRSARRRTEGISVTTKATREIDAGAAEKVELPARSRTGRKIKGATVGRNPDKVAAQTNHSYQRRKEAPEKNEINLPSSRKSNIRSNVETTPKIRTRSRFRDTTPLIDEQKLEVLPLFERETKTVKPIRQNKIPKQINSFHAEAIEMSATENDVTVVPKPPKQSVIIETRTESSFQRRKSFPKKPAIRETVISQVSEVTSKRSIPRTTAAQKPKKTKIVEVKKNSLLSSSEEDIGESDNYPPQFKALLQAKKSKQVGSDL